MEIEPVPKVESRRFANMSNHSNRFGICIFLKVSKGDSVPY